MAQKISSFIFEVVYAAGSENVLADALSRIYSNDSIGTNHAHLEYTVYDVIDEDMVVLGSDMPLLAGMEAMVTTNRVPRPCTKPGAETGWPEMSKEFAQRLRDRFVLRSPQKRTEGGRW